MKNNYLILLIVILTITTSRADEVCRISFDEQAYGLYGDSSLKSDFAEISWAYTVGRAFINDDVYRGKVLEVSYPAGGYGPDGSGAQFVADLPAAEEYYLDYFVKFKEGFDFGMGGKLPGLTSGGSTYTGGVSPVDGDGWSARYMWTKKSDSSYSSCLYLYYMNQTSEYGEDIDFDYTFETDMWYRITQHIRVNDNDAANGEIEVWINGVSVYHTEEIELRANSKGLIDSFYFSTFFGGSDSSWAPSVDCSAYFDDMVISTDAPSYLAEKPQDLINLDTPTAARFTLTDKEWGTEFGDASVCLWKGDNTAAFTITIDDNNEQDIEWWIETIADYDFNLTWFVITQMGTWPEYVTSSDSWLNVDDWNKFIALKKLGHYVDAHDDRNWYNTPTDDLPNRSDEEYAQRLIDTNVSIDAVLDSYSDPVKCYAYPYGEGNIDVARKYYIALRGTTGVLNKAEQVDYLNVNSISSVHLVANPSFYIQPLLDSSSTLYNTNYYRGWGSTHFHSVTSDTDRASTKEMLAYLDEQEGLWIAGFSEVAQYAQSRDTHTLQSTVISDSQIEVTLTDEMNDQLFTYPLTVKVRVNSDWASVTAIQGDEVMTASLLEYEGGKYLLVDVRPDGTKAVITAEIDNDPAVITLEESVEVEVGEEITIPFSASNEAQDAITFTVENLPSFVTLELSDSENSGTLHATPEQTDLGNYTITVLASNGTSRVSKSIKLTIVASSNSNVVTASLMDAAVYYPEHSFVDSNYRTNAIVGGGYVADKQMSAVFPFLMPETAAGKEIEKVTFTVYLESYNTPAGITGLIDLYTLPSRSSATVLVTDCYAGASDASDVNGTLIATDIVPEVGSYTGLVSLSDTGNETLTQYIQEEYDNVGAGSYLFLRLSNNDLTQTMYSRTMFTTADGAAAGDDPLKYPTLTFFYKDSTVSNDIILESATEELVKLRSNIISDDYLELLYNGEQEARLYIYNLQGVCVQSQILSPLSINRVGGLSQLPTQWYILRVVNAENIFTTKIYKPIIKH